MASTHGSVPTATASQSTFSEQIGIVVSWFTSWNDCEKVVALYCLIRKLPVSQAKFLAQVLDQIVVSCSPVDLEEQANDPGFIGTMFSSVSGTITTSSEPSSNEVIDLSASVHYLLQCLPLLRTGNVVAKAAYLQVLPAVLRHCADTGQYLSECQQILSYALIHPAISGEELTSLNACHQTQLLLVDTESLCASNIVTNTHRDLSAARSLPVGLYDSTSISSAHALTQANEGANANLPTVQLQQVSSSSLSSPSGLRQPLRRVQGQHPQLHRVTTVPDWVQHCVRFSPDNRLSVSGNNVNDSVHHVPLSPQSSDASSGSAGAGDIDDNNMTSSVGAAPGMHDVSSWLKSLRLHKYAPLFQHMTYDEMMSIDDKWLAEQNVTKGARNKILISVQKLVERAKSLRQLEKDVMTSSDMRSAIGELRQIICTPIRAYKNNGSCLSSESLSSDLVLPDADLPGLITRVLGKICTQLLVTTRPDNECLTSYLHLLDRCNCHQAFTTEHTKKILSWRQQIQRVLQFQIKRHHRPAVNSSSLPPCQPRSGSHRALRGQSPAGSGTPIHQQLQPKQQPLWTFVGSSSTSTSLQTASATVSSWQAASHSLQRTTPAAVKVNLCPPPVQSFVKLPLGRTHSAPLRSPQGGLSVPSLPQVDVELNVGNEDLHASLSELCISMMEAALDSGTTETV